MYGISTSLFPNINNGEFFVIEKTKSTNYNSERTMRV